MTFDAWKEGKVASSQHQIDVVAKPPLKLEAVSSRLRGTLSHSNSGAILAGLQYSPDGKRLVAGDWHSGVIQVWDMATGKELTKIESGDGYRRRLQYFSVTPDWNTVYVSRHRHSQGRIEKQGKQLVRWEFEGDVTAWDLNTGDLLETFKHGSRRGIYDVTLSPDGLRFLTSDQLSGEYERHPDYATSLWDVRRKTCRNLGKLSGGIFSPDSKTIVMGKLGEDSTKEIKLLDVVTANEALTIPITGNQAHASDFLFTRDGKVLLGLVRVYPSKPENDFNDELKFWDAETGKALASFAAKENKARYMWPVLSADDRLLAVTSWQGKHNKLHLFDVPSRTKMKSVALTEPPADQRMEVFQPVFSPDGRWLAVPTERSPKARDGGESNPEESLQPRIYLVDVVEGVVRETLIAPKGRTVSACFSPDGKTLATSGEGKVLLWDVSNLPAPGG